jgi:uncharacterized repeat protein (TIGR03803 family)
MLAGKAQFYGFTNLTTLLLIVAAAIASPAQTLTTLANLEGTNESDPMGSLVQGFDGNFYGTTLFGGTLGGGGTVFKITLSGTLTTLYSFCAYSDCLYEGDLPSAGLVLGTDGNFYGTTLGDGANGRGTLFQITPSGNLTTLYNFCAKANCKDGGRPEGVLIQATDGNFYGTTSMGGTSSTSCSNFGDGCGTVFKITPRGVLTTLYSFCSQVGCADGTFPVAGLVQGSDGSLYGTTEQGGLNGFGTTFKISPSGKFTSLHSFDSSDGDFPSASLIRGSDRNFYGTTITGGSSTNGTIFKMTPGGAVATVISFEGANGADPYSALVQATDGYFYGTTSAGGSGSLCNQTDGCGTVFRVNTKGNLTTLYSFCLQMYCPDGAAPTNGLVQGTDGNLYGMTNGDDTGSYGTVFRLSLGLSPFVKTLPTSGKVGATVIILGTNLTGSTTVSFDKIASAFTVVSSSEITTTVPAGATSGIVQVTTPGGTLSSNIAFRVTP